MRLVRTREWSRPPAPSGLEDSVGEILGRVRAEGDAALLDLTARFDGVRLNAAQLRVEPEELRAASAAVEPELLAALRLAIANVGALVEAQLREPLALDLDQGQHIEIAELPVGRAGVYVPGGRAAYPSSLVMCAATARAAGVDEIAVCVPPGPDGRISPLVLAACELCSVSEVHRVGGAQAIAALAFGTESVARVDVIAGPGNAWVQEAKRRLAGTWVGIDGIAGPSELVVVATVGAEPELVALDLLAQAEHGEDSPLWLVSPHEAVLDAVEASLKRMAPERPSVADAELQLVRADTAAAALAIAEEIAPEHLELVGQEAEELAGHVRRAGCLFVGPGAATAFGDYVAGSNHVLPTGGAARFQSALSAATFRRRMARVSLPGEAPARLAPAGAVLARAEGFPVHAESMERRA